MAEEIHSANIVIPWCMVSTTLLNGILGFAMLIVVLFVTVDSGAVLASPSGLLGFPFMQIFYDATGSISGASTMISIIIIMIICAAIAFLATSSRVVFAFGRDRGLPFWRSMSTVCRYRVVYIICFMTELMLRLYRSKQVPLSPCTQSWSWPAFPAPSV